MTIRDYGTLQETSSENERDNSVVAPTKDDANSSSAPARGGSSSNLLIRRPWYSVVLPVSAVLLIAITQCPTPFNSMYGVIYIFFCVIAALAVAKCLLAREIRGDGTSLSFRNVHGERSIKLEDVDAVYINHYLEYNRDGPDYPKVDVHLLLPDGEVHTVGDKEKFFKPLVEHLQQLVASSKIEESQQSEPNSDYDHSNFARLVLERQQNKHGASGSNMPQDTTGVFSIANKRRKSMYAGFCCAVQIPTFVILITLAYLLFVEEGSVSVGFFLFVILIGIFVLVSFMWIVALQFRFRPPRVLTPGTVEDTRVPLVSSALHLVCVIALDSYLIFTWNYLALQMGPIVVFLGVTMAIYTIVAVLHLWAFQQMAKAWRPPPSNLLHIQSTETGSAYHVV